jgi:hypothetical protein
MGKELARQFEKKYKRQIKHLQPSGKCKSKLY